MWLCWYLTWWGAIPQGAGRPTPGRLARPDHATEHPAIGSSGEKRIPPNGAASAGPWFHAAAGWGDGSAEATAASPVGYRATRLGLGNAAPSAKGSLALTKGSLALTKGSLASALVSDLGFRGLRRRQRRGLSFRPARLPSPQNTLVPQGWEVAEAGISPLSSLEEGSRRVGLVVGRRVGRPCRGGGW